ncbi:SGNH/GDSL hydrolase family protein [Microvirga guangxiensis]|uniref:GDSL-like Lipase/Acylhydrolase family protein n=1 Tax=Microvirga guangxiensis TaxID=549386 RepID=A0A1G5L4I7_9HYPH|nr:SGNH/GDSL hydrolase family protein [Microvirga guangxiensis]SCZ07787.1 GDSL-like Lipase/Acylhydrolase family protein [Microvirga guangxiensis]
MNHVVLLGDSVFDNGAYVKPGEPDVLAQVQAKLPKDWRATMRAEDGAVTTSIERQLARLPEGASHLILSVGGNDALSSSGILSEKANSVAEVMTRLADVRDSFARSYRKMLDLVVGYRLPTALCTIYDARFPDPEEQRRVVAALSVFNDVISREAFARRLALIDLRLICSEHDDYANPIEPSAKGGDKIAGTIAQVVAGNNIFPRSQVYAE